MALTLALLLSAAAFARPPNVIIVFADDQGYGDLGVQGHPSIRTPHIDRMAAEGARFTDFYSAAPVCTPSRAALLTGRHALRSGMCKTGPGTRWVLFPSSKGGLPPGEVTLAEALKAGGYATLHVGKWHLGTRVGSRPLDQGFDHSFGLPYSNDMDPRPKLPPGSAKSATPPADGWNVPLLRDNQVVEQPAAQSTLTRRYTDETVAFIRANREKPFFIYLAHSMPHVPLFASPAFKGRSARGIYGDVIEEIDSSVGEILSTLRAEGLAESTLVAYSSDNGPWLSQGAQGGSAGLLRDGKGTTWEGGVRVPGIVWMPGRVRPTVIQEPAGTLDLFPTIVALAGLKPPPGVELDGRDLGELLFEGRPGPERPFFYYCDYRIFACRLGPWKLHLMTQSDVGLAGEARVQDPALLYNLSVDPSEKYDVAAQNPEVVSRLRFLIEGQTQRVKPGPPET